MCEKIIQKNKFMEEKWARIQTINKIMVINKTDLIIETKVTL